MERDFLGLSSKEPFAAVKREVSEEESQWPFMRKASSFPHFMSFRAGAAEDDGVNKMVTDTFDRGQKSSMGEIQNFPLPGSNSFVKPSFTSSGQNVTDAIMRQQFQGAPMPVNSTVGPVVGFTEPWNNVKSFAAPGQMTIFYAGSVSVYDGISPEKAQAIMLLAGNGCFLGSNMKPPSPQVHSPVTKVPSTVADGVVSASKDEQVVTNTTGVCSTPVSKPEHLTVTSRGPVPMPTMVPSAVPQFRKASLARFLEKRKERMISSMPYSCEKKQEGIVPANNNMGSPMPSAANSGTSPAAAVRGS